MGRGHVCDEVKCQLSGTLSDPLPPPAALPLCKGENYCPPCKGGQPPEAAGGRLGCLTVDISLHRRHDHAPLTQARPATSPVCVFTRTVSPSLRNSATRTSRPVSSFATFVEPPAAVSPRKPRSVESMVSSTYCGN